MEQDVFVARRGAGRARCITFVRVMNLFREQRLHPKLTQSFVKMHPEPCQIEAGAALPLAP